jgi:protein TonB
MSRCALIVSLALHASFLILIGSWGPVTHDGFSTTGVAVSFSPGNPAESLLVEAAPAASPEPLPLLAEPEFSAPAPAVDLQVPVVSALTGAPSPLTADTGIMRTMPAKPELSPPKRARARSRAIVHAASGQRGLSVGPAGGDFGGGDGGSERSGYVPPQFRLRYKPPYPAAARAQHLEGTVLLLVSVDSAGRVTRAEIHRSCGHAVLDRAALDAVRLWRFEPARQNGMATDAQVEVPVRFRFG